MKRRMINLCILVVMFQLTSSGLSGHVGPFDGKTFFLHNSTIFETLIGFNARCE